MTNDFDLAVYVKGDRKSTAVFNAQLLIEYVGEVVEDAFDLAIDELEVPSRVSMGEEEEVEVTVVNNGPAVASGTVTLVGISNRGDVYEFSDSFTDLAVGLEAEFTWDWAAPIGSRPAVVTWTATVTAPADEDPDESNNTAVATTRVTRN